MRSTRQLALVVAALACGPRWALARGQEPEAPARLGPSEAAQAVDAFQAALDERWSYRHANAADFDGALARLRRKVAGGSDVDALGLALHEILALGIDGHSAVTGYRLPRGAALPFLAEALGERTVAFDTGHKAFLAEGFPFLVKIDGRRVEQWCAASAALVVKGSPQLVRVRSLRQLRELDFWRSRMKLPRRATVEVELADAQGRARKRLRLLVAESAPSPGPWPPAGSRLLEGNVGYLRLATLTSSAVREIERWLPEFRGTAGLIVDVRDNNGGDRDALRLLYSFLAAPDDPPHVFNAAAYRLHPAHKPDHLAENHHMFLAGAAEWTPPEREAVAAFAKSFRPRWELPRGQFSDWHYMALVRLDDPRVYHYERPVVVLMNSKCFSATDVFLAGLKGVRGVLLLGTPSSGGSAYTQEVALGPTPLKLRIGSIASFQADGRLFDGNGVLPDVALEAVPEYYVGGRDNLLEEALARIRAASGAREPAPGAGW